MDHDSLYFTSYNSAYWIFIYDYQTDPSSPDWIDDILLSNSPVEDMAIMYPETSKESLVVCQSDGLYAYNVYDPTNPQLVDSVSTNPPLTMNRFMAVSGEYIIKILYNSIGGGYFLQVLHYTDGLSLDQTDSIAYPDSYVPTALDAYGSWIVVGSYTGVNELSRVYSFADPANITYDSQPQTFSQCIAVGHDTNTLALLQEAYYPRLYDITGFVAPTTQMPKFFNNDAYPTESLIIGDYMYSVGNFNSMHYRTGINLVSPPDAFISNQWTLGYDTNFLAGNEKIIAHTRGYDQLYFARPEEGSWQDGSSFNLPQDVTSIAVYDDYMYVVMQNPSTMKVYNIALFPGSDPTELPNVSCSPAVQKLIVQGEAMYGFDLDTMFIFSLATPSAPAQDDVFVAGMNIENRLIFGDWLFLLLDSQLVVVDISDPMNPVTETTVDLPYSGMKNITRMEQYIICSSESEHPVFIDISDPANPSIYGQPITDDPVWPIRGLDSKGGFLYELCDSYGVRIYQLF